MNNPTNVTATGIAVACAVIVAIAFLFFGPSLLGLFNHAAQSNSLTSTTTNMTDQNTPASSTNSLNVPANVTELMGKDVVVGTGAEAKAGDKVTVNYVGMLTNGQVFDASANHGTQGFSFTLGAGQVIKGWDQGVAGMKVGGKRELVIPASLGYGAQAMGPIPANSTLVFQVELLDVQPSAQ
jgi:FKBP-type peptidyl-prolyl cis-trans isomerase